VDKLNLVTRENLTGMRVIRAFNTESYEEKRIDEANRNLTKTSLFVNRLMVIMQPVMMLLMNLTTVLIIWVGANAVGAGSMQVGELTGFLSYVMQVMNSLMMISNVFLLLTRSLASAGRIVEVLEEPADITDGDPALRLTRGDIEFDHVSFKYHAQAKENVLTDINLRVKAGETLGIIGGTGSAKSTLVQLIPRLYEVSEGTLRVGGHDVRAYPLAHLRDAIGIVLQKNVLFSGTVRENLKWGNPDADDAEIEWAARTACADEFIRGLDKGYDTYLEEGGVNVSGGQKQRLCIARALLKHPRILIFDDSTSAVDTATDARIREGLAALKDTTKLIIAQRVTSIMHADQIIILDEGRITACGTHSELLASSPVYQELYASQQKGVSENG